MSKKSSNRKRASWKEEEQADIENEHETEEDEQKEEEEIPLINTEQTCNLY